jgi:hypothetical protein
MMRPDLSWWYRIQRYGLLLLGGLIVMGLPGCTSLTTPGSSSMRLSSPLPFTSEMRSDSS